MRQERYIKESIELLLRINDDLEEHKKALGHAWIEKYLKEIDYILREGKALL